MDFVDVLKWTCVGIVSLELVVILVVGITLDRFVKVERDVANNSEN